MILHRIGKYLEALILPVVVSGVFASVAGGTNALADQPALSKRMSIGEFFNEATFENMADLCEEVYHPDVEFQDPVHKIKGRDKLTSYYRNMYENVISIAFDVHQEMVQGDEVMVRWTMRLRHKRLDGGDEFAMDGVSHIAYRDKKIIFHRDYFDLGEMLYERIPIVGAIIRGIKNKAGAG